MTAKYNVYILYNGEVIKEAILSVGDRFEWSKRWATKLAKEFTARHGIKTEVREA